ncbi:MAG: cytochrome c-type biogenesis CcmF C-terminal domain-containing protein, partial [Balneolaceae bacterium]|nr:cytochrome c-type biogenesis CcmF C-terminal domain-containing protein [Balneolaceae bacterium]
AILAYVAVVYETFLTRSGILSDSSVHSFVDLGLYNQLLAFMFIVTAVGVGLLLYRYKDLPQQQNESKLLSREFMTFAGAMILFLIGLVIAIGTSSPIIGRLFESNPTPPEISFYNEWTMPLAILAAILTVVGQQLFWKRQDAESLARDLTWPVLISCVLTLATMVIAEVRDFYYLVYILAGWFAVIGNGFVMYRLLRRNPKLIGGSLTHLGFGMLLLGILASSVYNESLLDRSTRTYNQAVEEGKVTDDQGVPVTQKVRFLELRLNEPKVVNDQYLVTYEGYTLADQSRPGQQQYKIKFEPADGEGRQFYLYPEVYPMLSSSSAERIEWSVDPDVYTGWFGDIYLYVAGSSYVEQRNEAVKERTTVQPAATRQGERSSAADTTETESRTIHIGRGETVTLGGYRFGFDDYVPADPNELPDSTSIAVRANLGVTHVATGRTDTLRPLFAIYTREGKNWTFSPPTRIPGGGSEKLLQFTNVEPSSGKIELTVSGIDADEEDWVLIVAEEKPFISVVWLGTFVLMAGFSVSIFRHWERERRKS